MGAHYVRLLEHIRAHPNAFAASAVLDCKGVLMRRDKTSVSRR
jgi:hypothetical protein